MTWTNLFRRKPSSASVAKDRLQIIVARERRSASGNTGYLAALQQELLAVIAKYETVDLDQVTVSLDRRDDGEVLELNIVLPDPGDTGARSRGRVAFA